jgi:hypothetical protein
VKYHGKTQDRNIKQILFGCRYQWEVGGEWRVCIINVLTCLYENRTMKPVEIGLTWGEVRKMRKNDEGGESNQGAL